jgi:hypothetical protein
MAKANVGFLIREQPHHGHEGPLEQPEADLQAAFLSNNRDKKSNNRILNQLLAAREDEIYKMLMNVLGYALQIAPYKSLILSVLALLNKTIVCIKTLLPPEHSPDTLTAILSTIIDVLIAVSAQHRDNQDTSLRVLQTTFSLIDHLLVPLFSEGMVTRMFSICFEFSQGCVIVQNISVSALLALIESLVQFGGSREVF